MINKNFISGFICSLLFLAFSSALSATTITGKVTDSSTQEALAGANVVLMGTNLGTASEQDGTFKMDNVPPGDYTLAVNFIGFRVEKKRVTVGSQDIHIDVRLRPVILKGQEVVVTANRATQRETPIAFTDISNKEIEREYWAQDIPMLLMTVPGAYSYSDAGNGIGYSYLKIRGFDQKRVEVMINGIPLNDPEDHNVYWVDMPDLAASVQDIQIQRGVGSSLYGSGAFGGSVNILTSELTNQRSINVTGGMGSYNTRKFTAQFNSGLVDNTYAISGRFSKVNTDGYRDRSVVDLWSYFISVARYGVKSTIRLNLYGGPELTHAAWDGSSAAALSQNHRDNPITYPNTVDNFNQPHYELIHDWHLSDKLDLSNTLFYISGKGYYETFKSGRDLRDYGFQYFYASDSNLVEETDLVRQKWVAKEQIGWIPRLTVSHRNGSLTLGGDLYTYTGDHWGKVIWADQLPPGAAPDHKYYQYNGDKFSGTGFVHELWNPNGRWQVMADLNLQYKTYEFKQDKVGNFVGSNRNFFDISYLFFNPKFGLNFNLNPHWNVFGNFSIANLEPNDDDLYDTWTGPDELGVPPLFANSKPVSVNGSIDHIEWSSPLTKPERVHDFELGVGYARENLHLKANGYYMNFTNEIVPYGQIRDNGAPVKGNAESTVHRGIEVEFGIQRAVGADFRLGFSGNLSMSQNYFSKFTQYNAVYDDNWNLIGTKPISLNGNTIAGFPGRQGLARLTLEGNGLSAYLQWHYVGKQYLDNTEEATRTISTFDVATLYLAYDLRQLIGLSGLKISLWVNNLFNNKYETAGYYDGGNYYYPAARRNYFVGVTTSL
jgi:iron complex outermembrane receptor protein